MTRANIPGLFCWIRLLGFLVAFPLLGAGSEQERSVVDINVPAQAAARALLAFSKQAGVEMLFSYDTLQGVKSNAVRGRFSPEAALEQLLRGTGFIAQRSALGTYVVAKAPPPPAPPKKDRAKASAQPVPTTTKLDPVIVNAETARSPYGDARGPPHPRTAGGNLDLDRAENGTLPYVVFERDQIVRSGLPNLNEFLQQEVLDSDASTRSPDENGNAATFSAGSTNINLRGFSNDETVILVNGRRLPDVLTNAGDNQPNSYVSLAPDVDFIPINLVQKIEVLPVSAAALYMGNPVGGVINIVLRDDVNATEVSATYTNAVSFHAPQSTLSMINGETLLGGKLKVLVNASFSETVPATEGELGYIRKYVLPAQAAPFYRATPNVVSANGTPLFGPGTADFTSVPGGADGSGGLGAFTGRQGVPSLDLFRVPGGLAASPDSLDFPYGRYQKSASYFGSVTYDVLPRLQIGGDAIYTHTSATRGLDVFQGNLVLGAASAFNPFHQDVDVTLNESAPADGAGYSEAQFDFTAVVLAATLKLPGKWEVAVDGQYATNVVMYRGLAGIDPTRWQQLVDEGLYNPLRDTQVYGPPQALYDQALFYYGGRGRFVNMGDSNSEDGAFRITNTELLLPTGTAIVNAGLDYRRDQLGNYTQNFVYVDGSPEQPSVSYQGRALAQYGAFEEFQVPLLPVRWLPSPIRRVEADLAVRYDAGSGPGDSNVSPTFGLKIDGVGGWSFRGSVTTARRFPTPQLSSQVAGPSGPAVAGTGPDYINVFDPILGMNENVIPAAAPNIALLPEEAVTQTAGFIFERGTTKRVRALIDFIDTRKINEQQYLSADEAVALESYFPTRVIRAAPAPGSTAPVGIITEVIPGTINIASRHSDDINFSLDYAWSECLGGTLDLYDRFVFVDSYKRQLFPGSSIVDELRSPDGSVPGLLRYRSNFGAGWANKEFGFGFDGRYYHSRVLPQIDWQQQGSETVNPYWQFDTYLQWDLGRLLPWKRSHFGLRTQARLNNILGTRFPEAVDSDTGTGVQPYGDWRGRVYSLSVTLTF